MQPNQRTEHTYAPTAPPYSPSLPPETANASPQPSASPVSNGFNSTNNSPGIANDRAGSHMSASGSNGLDKGKAVIRESSQHDEVEEDEAERQRKVERVLKRAEAAKLARTFRNRLASVGSRTRPPWQNSPVSQAPNPPPLPPAMSHFLPQQPQHFPSPAPSPYVPQQHTYLPPPSMENLPPPPVYAQHPPPPQPHFSGGMEATLGNHAPPNSKRARQEHTASPSLESCGSYSNSSVYAPQPQPVQSVSPYSTAGVYQASAERPSKRRHALDSNGPSRIGTASPRARTKSGRRSPGKGQNPALSSSDPTFSSFVDAAAALTGMARAPSDPSQNGSDEDGSLSHPHPTLFGHHAHSQLPHSESGSPFLPHFPPPSHSHSHSTAFPPPPPPLSRPATPDRATGGLAKLPGAPSAGGSEGTAAEAADLMLFLAHSPSPKAPKRSTNHSLGGDGMGVKGRRLFSGTGGPGEGGGGNDGPGHGSGVFGGELAGSPFAGANGGGGGLGAGFGEPSKTASRLPPPPPSSSSRPLELGGASVAPAMGQRQTSMDQANWEAFVNAMPSPDKMEAARRASGGQGEMNAKDAGALQTTLGGETEVVW
ncbi:hypothetical protein JCM11641_006336 [Rhodosporidiobolus odoratus]